MVGLSCGCTALESPRDHRFPRIHPPAPPQHRRRHPAGDHRLHYLPLENGKEVARRPVQMALAHLASDVERGVLDLEASLEMARASQPPEPACLEVVEPDPRHDEAA